MAPTPVLLPLLWSLSLIHGASSLCNVTCWTDYEALLNCSCSGSVPAHPVQVTVVCRGFEAEVSGSCDITPPQSWCAVAEDLEEVASTDTECSASVKQRDEQDALKVTESRSWKLSDVVKPRPPFSVRVADVDGFYNVTWAVNNTYGCLRYRVRIRESTEPSKDPDLVLKLGGTFVPLKHNLLQQHVTYTVDLQAQLCTDWLEGPWSEWSSSAQWRTGAFEAEGGNRSWCYVFLPVLLLFGLLLLAYLYKPFWQKKIQVITNVPKPNDFFKPLYHSYGGNFKEWVKPVFREFDYVSVESVAPMMSEKLRWSNEKLSYGEDAGAGERFLQALQPHANLLLHLQDAGRSTGHVSILTVTLDGEVASQGSMRSYQDGGSLGSYEEDDRRPAGYEAGEQLCGGGAQNQLSLENLHFEPRGRFVEAERASLDSFASHEQSEDGYPHVDLDTIDSGFVECSSPGVSPSGTAGQTDSDPFQEHKNSNSNYVKQWMICSAIQEDCSSESELQQTQ
ncbi:interleukin 21 receptor, tandem duplicate 1 [Betta splendens]|uniref:Interleukin 21 receptor, tandem duplicate 1 n=1 Tax=Betta splendens TaxID=158456 RepID=A0A6P7KUJ6_BETSP|nr:interleukin 21 receptor, tandem duplicate 1 [Betta splendens]XP_028986179.1 interleukin 21 receptor, tandem duplicate 1 [Betta splendens]XP_028986181.1 interleukin 21 receptor, tandem duplicate 1 [Betta splendens]XP_028986182.1 interleukin 21 receptor, tandem duplicate 1 [Betta splendens]XP_028986183.1 interleukin 21 receptor, tandem duplicate 1 [Betta splendens]XP_028986187.1 interleukin 21 receptor, tandem duplicate 1 [Betta splendens]XP_028986191.1 interleukin 21 receptor, tandem duplic